MKLISTLAIALTVTFFSSQQSKAASFNEFPACTSEKVLRKLVKRFNQTEKIYWQARGHALTSVSNPHQHAENPFPYSPINRLYCHGDAHFADGSKRRIHYLIEEGAGFAGFTWNVEYCVHGLDPWKYYDGRCRVLSKRN